MANQRERDLVVEHMLRQRREDDASPAPGTCLDADAVAAWMDGALTRDELLAAEAHAARCLRCQTLLAAAVRTGPGANAAMESRPRLSGMLRWLAPLTAAAAAVTVWIAVAPEQEPVPAARTEQTAIAPAAPAVAPPAIVPAEAPRSAKQEARGVPAGPRESPSSQDAAKDRADAIAPKLQGQTAANDKSAPTRPEETKTVDTVSTPAQPVSAPFAATATPPAAAAAPPPPPASPELRRTAAAPAAGAGAGAAQSRANALTESVQIARARAPIDLVIVTSPGGTAMWRAHEGAIERSIDRGVAWERQFSLDDGVALAGASPSTAVCWIGGRAGLILRSTDGRTWRRVAFSERVDVVEVQATDGNRATVRLSDGRRFSTTDGGATWSPVPLQESPAAPF